MGQKHVPQARSAWAAPFFTVWTGQAFSLVGSRVLQFALVWWLTQMTGSATILAMATMTMIIPQVFLAPVAGTYVDRQNRRVVMIVADSVIALAALGLAYLFWTGNMQVWHVYVGMLVRAIGESVHWPAMQASTSLMVPDQHLTRVAGLNQTMQGALNTIGPPLGAFFLAVMPLHGVMLLDVGTALLAIAPLFFVHIPQPSNRHEKEEPGASMWADLRQGLRYVQGWPGLLAVMIMATVINFIANPAFSLMPLLVQDHFQGGAVQLGWLESSWGVGLVLGGLLLSAWGGFRRRVYTSLAALMVEGVGIALVGLAPENGLGLAVGGMFLAGGMNALVNGPLFALLQAEVDPKIQGRVFTAMQSMSCAAWPLSLAVAGPIADAVGVRPWYVVGGVVTTLMGLGACFVPPIVNIERNGHRAAGRQAQTPPAVPVRVDVE